MAVTCSDLSDDVLAERPTPEVRAHLDSCAPCRSRAVHVGGLVAALRAIAPPLRKDRALVRRIQGRLRFEVRTPAAFGASPGRWVAAAAAAVLIAGALVVATRAPDPPTPVAVHAPTPPPREAGDPLPSPDPGTPPPAPPRPIPPAPSRRPEAPAVPAPASKETPAESAAPGPTVPEKSTPDPAPLPRPAAPPAETQPARVSLAIALAEGALELGGKKLEKDAEWEKSALLRGGEHLSRVTLPGGTRLTLGPRAELRLEGAEAFWLDRGEVFCEVIPGVGRKLAILTPDAAVQVTGTQFGVRHADHTEIFVTAGEVRVSNDRGEVLVPAGSGTTVRKASAPARPRGVDVDSMAAWRKALDPPETPRFRYDFEDGRRPLPWQGGRIVPGPARGLNKNCLEGSPGINLDLSRVDRKVATVKGTLKVRFRYWAPEGDMLWVQLFDDRVRDNFRIEVKPLVHQKWETVEAPLADFFLLSDGAAKIQPGDRLSWFNVSVSGTSGPVFFDDIELVEVLK